MRGSRASGCVEDEKDSSGKRPVVADGQAGKGVAMKSLMDGWKPFITSQSHTQNPRSHVIPSRTFTKGSDASHPMTLSNGRRPRGRTY